MYSYYVLHESCPVNNNDTDTVAYVLADRDDLQSALDDLIGVPGDLEGLSVVCQLRVYQHGHLTATLDLLEGTHDYSESSVAIPPMEAIPKLEGTPLPPGHPVQVDGRPLAYGCNRFCP